MTRETELKLRQFFGWCTMAGAIFLTALTGYKAHMGSLKQAELAAQQTARISERQDIMYGVLESSVYPICVMNQEGKVIVWNLAMERLTGLSCAEAISEGFEQIMPDEAKKKQHRDGVTAAFADKANIGRLTLINCTIQHHDTKEMIPVHISVRVFEAGEKKKLFATARMVKDSDVVTFGDPPSIAALKKRLQVERETVERASIQNAIDSKRNLVNSNQNAIDANQNTKDADQNAKNRKVEAAKQQ